MQESTKTEKCMQACQEAGLRGIPVDEILPVREVMRRLGWGQHAFNHAKKQGLRVLAFSKYSYI